MSNRIVLSANTSWYLYNFRRSTIKALVEQGYKVTCLSPKDDYSDKLISELYVEWIPLNIHRHSTNPIKDLFLLYQFIHCYRKLKPIACLHYTIKNNIFGSIAAKITSCKVINNITGLGTLFIKKSFATSIAVFLYKLSNVCSDIIFCQNPVDRDFLIKERLVSKEKLILIPGSGVDLNKFNPSQKEQRSNNFRFLYVGRMLRDKGVYELIDAFNSIDQSKTPSTLYLVGFIDTDSSASISMEQIRNWTIQNSNIVWVGHSDSMAKIYANCDCVVLPSYREGLPRSLLEAGAMGLPSIASNVPGCSDVIINGYNGLLCEVKNAEDLASRMVEISSMDSEALNAIGINARNHVENKYDERIVVDATLNALNRVSS